MKQLSSFFKKALVCMAALSLTGMAQAGGNGKTWVDYVNPYIGNISHLLVPTFPTVQLPNSMLRVYPERADFTADRINGLPLIVTHHRERSAFNLSVYCGDIGSLRDNVISGRPWMAQKRIRTLLKEWFRNDLMGVPGDEDGGGMSAFVVFSMIGIYPVTPGLPVYNIGSPMFPSAKIHLSNGKTFEIEAQGASDVNKYIQSAALNGKQWDKPWLTHDDLVKGGRLVLVMGDKANRKWGSRPEDAPPSGVK